MNTSLRKVSATYPLEFLRFAEHPGIVLAEKVHPAVQALFEGNRKFVKGSPFSSFQIGFSKIKAISSA